MFAVKNAYDSHVHWMNVGLKKSVLQLHNLNSPEDITLLSTKPNRGAWVTGVGWDQNSWGGKFPSKTDLQHISSPVAFTRVDGHALWVNDIAIKLVGGPETFSNFSSEMCHRDESENLTGILIDSAMNPVLDSLPAVNIQEQGTALLSATQYFNRQGFTHIRDLTCSSEQWEAATQLEEENLLTLAVEEYFDCLPYRSFDLALKEALYAKSQFSKLRRVVGIKVFFDGALGSEGALISCCYPSGKNGLQLMDFNDLTEVACLTWENNLRLAIHIIGDEAAHRVVDHFVELKKRNISGPIDLEHCQMMRSGTLENLKHLDVTVHMQPCHWLSDKRWLDKKLSHHGAKLFPWSEVEKLRIPLFFGSDAPIEPSSILINEGALLDAAENGIPRPTKLAAHFQSHPDSDWIQNCWSEFSDQNIDVYFDGKKL